MKAATLFLVSFLCFAASPTTAADSPPNIVVLLADDLGWADVGYHDSEIRTPHIDRLQQEGVELDRFYVAPMCTPTRVGLLTGRYWSRFGNTKPSNKRVLPYDTMTLPKALKTVGYKTFLTGKWHLGSSPEWGPGKFGFDESYGSLAGGVTPWTHLYKTGPYSRTWHRNGELIDEEGHVTDLIVDEAVRFIDRPHKQPFFIYVAFTAVHTPFQEPDEWLATANHIEEKRRQYVACAHHMDDGIGRILEALEKRGVMENTIIVFFSDNGGTKGDDSERYPDTKSTTSVQGLNHPLKGWKMEVYEGGIRVPAIVHWKNRLKPGKITEPVHVVDLMPTFATLAGYKPAADLQWDGVDLNDLLSGKTDRGPRSGFYCKGVGGAASALVKGDWKLVVRGGKQELYRLSEDPNERTNLAAKNPERVKDLLADLLAEQKKDNDALPDRSRD